MNFINEEDSIFIGGALKNCGGYRDLESPVILTSGELGIYYSNTEKLLLDNGKFNEYGDSARNMINHAIGMAARHKSFGKVIDILAKTTQQMFEETGVNENKWVVSGGQRRDWLFSGPVAYKLNLPHASLYKDGEKIEVFVPVPSKTESRNVSFLNGARVIHIVDLLTEGSSCYRSENGVAMGWIPMLRSKRAKIDDLISVVTRLQGGESRLMRQDIKTHAFVKIDDSYLVKNSEDSARTVKYFEDPARWSENYLRHNGALSLLNSFDPAGGKLDRAKKFLLRYGDVLIAYDKYDELNSAVRKNFRKELVDIII